MNTILITREEYEDMKKRLSIHESEAVVTLSGFIDKTLEFLKADAKSQDQKAWSLGFGLAMAGHDAEAIHKRLAELEGENSRMKEVLRWARQVEERDRCGEFDEALENCSDIVVP